MLRLRGGTVHNHPVLPLRSALGWDRQPSSRSWPFPLNHPRTVLTYSGTAAVYQAVRALQLPAGSTALCPSYNCGHEIEPLLRLGLKVQCYRVGSDLEIDLEDIERRMGSEVRMVLVTHYFGFGQQLEALRALCDRHGAFLVEDCAHAFLSDTPNGMLGRVGDVAAFSIRKSLSLPNGGAVLFNNPSLPIPRMLQAPPSLSTWCKALDLTRKAVVDQVSRDFAWRNLVPLAALAPVVVGSDAIRRLYPNRVASYDPDDEDYDFALSIMNWGASALTQRLLDQVDWQHVAARRLANYRFLAKALQGVDGCRILRPTVPDATTPLYFPILVRHRDDLYSYLARRRIFASPWWANMHPAVYWEHFPEAIALKSDVLALPLHQGLTQDKLEYMCAELRAYPAW